MKPESSLIRTALRKNQFIALLALAGMFAPHARAASETWVSTTGGDWSVPGSWSNGIVSGSTGTTTSPDVATFNTNPATLTVGLAENYNLADINFDTSAGSFTIGSASGGTLVMTAGGAIQILATETASSVTETINAPILMEGGLSLINVSGATTQPTLTIAGPITGTATGGNTYTLTLGSGNTGTANSNTISGNISDGSSGGNVGLAMNSKDTWTISGSNSFTGPVNLAQGTLLVTTANGLGATAATSIFLLTGASGGLTGNLTYTGPSTTINRTIFVSGLNLASPTITANGSGPLTLAGSTFTLIGAGNMQLSGTSAGNTVSGVISGAGSGLSKLGSGSWILTGANTYTGVTTITTGTLQIGNGGATGSLSTTSAIADNANLTFNRSNAVTQGVDFSGAAITGTGSLTQVGSGILTLNAANTFSGGVAVNNSTLALSFANGSATNILAPASAVALSGGVLNVNSFTTGSNAQTLGSLVVNPGASTISMTSTGSGIASLTITAGTITRTGGGTVDFVSPANTGITLTGVAGNGLLGTYELFGTGTSETYAATNASAVVIAATLTNAGASSGINGFTSPTTNYTYVSPGTTDTTLTTGTASANTAVFNNATAQTITLVATTGLSINGFLNTNAALTINGPGKLIIGGSNELVIGGTSNVTISAPIVNTSGSTSALTDSDPGTLTLAGADTYTGPTTVNAGTLQLNGSLASSTLGVGTAGTLAGTGTASGNATLTGNGVINFGGGGLITGNLGVTGGNWNGVGIVGGLVTLSSGDFNIGSGASLTTNSTLNVTGGFISSTTTTGTITGNVNYTSPIGSTFNGVIAGAGSLTMNSAGTTLTLGGADTYTGGTAVNAGTLTLNGSLGNTGVNVGGGTLNLDGSNVIHQNTLTVSNAASLVTENTVNALGGSAALTITAGAVVLSQANNFTGAINVGPGTLQLQNAGSIGSAGSFTFTSTGTLQLHADSNTAFLSPTLKVNGAAPTINVDDVTPGITGNTLSLSGTVLLPNSNGSFKVTNGDNYNLTIAAVTASFNPFIENDMNGGTLTINALTDTNANTETITFQGLVSFSGTTVVTDITGPNETGALNVMIGNPSETFAAVVLGAGCTYSGTTTVEKGTLTVVGPLGNTPVTFGGVYGNVLNLNCQNALNQNKLTVNNQGNVFENAANGLGGTVALTATTGGNVQLSQPNDYTGATTIYGGTFVLGNTLAAENSVITINAANGLQFSPGIGAFTIGGLNGGVGETLSDSNNSGVVLSVGNNNNTGMTYSGVLTGAGGLTMIGAGTQSLTGLNTYAGATTVNAGTLALNFGAAAPSSIIASYSALVLGGGTLSLTGYSGGAITQSFNTLTVNAGAGTILLTSSGSASFALTASSSAPLMRNAGGTVDFIAPAGTTINLAGNISSPFLGTYAFSGSGASETYAATDINGNVIAATSTAASGINNFTSAASNYSYASPMVSDTLTNTIATANTALFNTASAQTIELGAHTLTINGFLNNGAALTIQSTTGGGTGTLTIGSSYELVIGGTSNVTIAAPIVNNGGNASALTDSNTGALTLSGVSTYTGATTVGAGTLTITGSLGNTPVTVYGATLNLNAASAISQNTLTVNSEAAVVTESTANALAGSAALTVNGGLVTLSRSNNYNGPTTVSGGTLTVSGSLGATTVTVSGGTLNLNGASAINQNTLTVNNALSVVTENTTNGLGGTATLNVSAGTVLLTQANNYTGGTTVTGGVVQLGNAFAAQDSIFTIGVTNGLAFSSGVGSFTIGGLSGAGNQALADAVNGAVALTVGNNNNNGMTYAGVLSGPGSLLKVGAGSQALTGANTYTGATTITTGTLQIGAGGATGSLSTSSAITDNGNLTFNRSNAVTQGVDFSGGSITGGGSLTQAGGGILTLNVLNTFSGGVAVNGGTLALSFPNASTNNIVASTNALSLGGGALNVSSFTAGSNAQTLASLAVNPGANTISMTAKGSGTDSLTFTTGAFTRANGGTVDFVSPANTSITLTGVASNGFLGSFALFGTGTNETYAATNASGVVISATATAATSNGIVGFTSGTANYAYKTPLAGGTDATLISGTAMANTAVFNNASAQTIALSANTGLSINGFLNTNFALIINGLGQLIIGGSNELVIGGTSNVTISAPIVNTSGSTSALTDSNTGTLTLAGANTYTGPTTVNAGKLQVNGSLAAASTVGVGTAGTLAGTGTAGGNATLTGNGVISFGSGGLIAGTLGVTGGNWNGVGSVTGLVTLSSGNFNIGTNANLTANGGLNITGGSISSTDNTGTITGSVNYTSPIGSTFNGVIAGAGTLTMNSVGTTLTLGGANTYTGATAVSAGTLAVTGALGNTAVTVNAGGTLNLNSPLAINQNTLTINSNLSVLYENTPNAIGGSAALTVTAGELVLSQANTYSGATTISGGAVVQLANAYAAQNSTVIMGAANDLTFSTGIGGVTIGGLSGAMNERLADVSGNAVALTVGNNNASTTYSGVLSGPGSLVAISTGTLTLTAANTYTGGTTLDGGGLVINGSLPAVGQVIIGGPNTTSSTPTLSGTGIVNGFVILASDDGGGYAGTINPGPVGGIGTLTVAGIAFEADTVFNVDINGAAASELVITGAATMTSFGTINISFNPLATPTLGNYVLATAASGLASGNPFTGTPPANYVLIVSDTAVDLTHEATIGAIIATPAAASIITGGSTAFTFTVSNSAPVNSLTLAFSATSAASTSGSVAGPVSVAPQATSGPTSGLSFTGTGIGAGQTGSFIVSDPNSGNLSVSGSVTVNVYDHAAPSLTSGTLNLGDIHQGYISAATSTNSLVVNNAAGFRSALKGSGTQTGATTSGLTVASIGGAGQITPGTSGTISASLGAGLSVRVINQNFNYTFADDSALSGASSNVGAAAITVAGQVYSGQMVWTGATGGIWSTDANWNDSANAAVHAAPGLDPNFTTGDTASFGNTSGPVTVNLNGAAPSLNAVTFTGAGTYTIAKGTGSTGLTLAGAAPSITAAGTNTISAPVRMSGTLTATMTNPTDSLTVSGAIADGTGSGALTKAGAGMLTLSGDNTYSGATNVNAGTLIVTGSLSGTGAVKVNAGTLRGTGLIDGVTTVASGATINPGLPGALTTGTLSIGNTVTFNTGSTFRVDIDNTGNASDLLAITGNLTVATGDTLTLNLLNSTPSTNRFIIATFTGTESGTFAAVNNLPTGYQVDYSQAHEIVVEAAVPEPGTWALLLGGLGGLGIWQRSRRRG